MLRDALRVARRERLTDPRSWLAQAIVWVAAVGVGLAIVGFEAVATPAFGGFEAVRQRWPLAPLLLTPAVGIASLWLSRRYFRGSEGGGIPQVIAAATAGLSPASVSRFVSILIALGKLALVVAGFAGGFSIGREGPSVQIGACLLHSARRWLPGGHSIDSRSLIVAGGAAGMAATFNTPLAGIVFAIEQLARRFDERTNGTLIAAIIWAGLVSMAILGNYTYFGRLVVSEISLAIIPLVVASGVACSLAGGIFSRIVVSGFATWPAKARFQRLRPAAFAGLCGLIVAVIGVSTGGATFGGGYEVTQQVIGGDAGAHWHHAAARFVSTAVSTLSGIPGGLFGPSLAIGAGIGNEFAPLVPAGVSAAAVVALCMAGDLAAVTDAALTSFVVVMEMIDGHAMVLRVMAVVMVARLVSRLVSVPLYDTLARRMVAQLPGQGTGGSASGGTEVSTVGPSSPGR